LSGYIVIAIRRRRKKERRKIMKREASVIALVLYEAWGYSADGYKA
jgi:hypothetical protein